MRVTLTSLHALTAVETFGVVVIDAPDVRAHIQNFIKAAAWAYNCFGFLKPSDLLLNVHLIFFVQEFVEPEHVKIGQEFDDFGLRVVPMIHL